LHVICTDKLTFGKSATVWFPFWSSRISARYSVITRWIFISTTWRRIYPQLLYTCPSCRRAWSIGISITWKQKPASLWILKKRSINSCTWLNWCLIVWRSTVAIAEYRLLHPQLLYTCPSCRRAWSIGISITWSEFSKKSSVLPGWPTVPAHPLWASRWLFSWSSSDSLKYWVHLQF
jgi:hypothetical protein